MSATPCIYWLPLTEELVSATLCIYWLPLTEEIRETADKLIDHLDQTRTERWKETVESINFTHSSREAWSTINRLTGRKKSSTKQANAPRASEVATAFVNNGKFKNHDKAFKRKVQELLREQRQKPSVDDQLCQAFTPAEMTTALKILKAGKAPGPDDIHPEYIIHLH